MDKASYAEWERGIRTLRFFKNSSYSNSNNYNTIIIQDLSQNLLSLTAKDRLVVVDG